MPWFLYVVSLVLVVATAAHFPAIINDDHWYPCSGLFPTVAIECNSALVPLDYNQPFSSPSNRISIPLFRLRPIRLTPTAAKSHLWMVSGSAAFIADFTQNGFDGLSLFENSVVVYSFDRRGTGQSVFDCPVSRDKHNISGCADEVDSRCGPGFRNNFTLSNVGRDMDTLIGVLSVDLGVPFHVEGLSVGSAVVQRYLQVRTSDPVSITLEGVVPSGAGWTLDIEFTQTSVAHSIMTQCANDAFCAAQFNGVNPWKALVFAFETTRDHPQQSCFARMLSDPSQLPVRVHRFFAEMVAALISRPIKASLLPALAHLMYRCNDRDIKNFPYRNYIAEFVDTNDAFSFPAVGYLEAGELYADVNKTPSLAELLNMVDQLPAGSGVSWNLGRFNHVWPMPPLDVFYKQLPNTNSIPVLIINGDVDTQTSLTGAMWLAKALSVTNPNVKMAVIPNAGHQAVFRASPTLTSTVPCGMSIWSSFVMSQGKQLNMSCVNDMVPPDFQFKLPQTYKEAVAWFGTANIWA